MNKSELLRQSLDKRKIIYIITLLAFILIVGFLSIWPIKLIETLVNLAVVGESKNIRPIILIGSTYLIAQILRALLHGLMTFLTISLQHDIGMEMQKRIYSKLLNAELTQLQGKSANLITSTLIEDIEYVINNLIKPVTKLLFSIITFGIGLYYMLTISWMITLLIIPLGLISSLTSRFVQKRYAKNISEKRKISNKLWKVFGEGIRGIMPIRIHGYQNEYQQKVLKSSKEMKNISISQAKIEGVSYFLMSSLFMVTIGGILIVSAVFVVNDYITIGGLTAIMMYNHMLVDPLINLLDVQQSIIKLRVSLDRVTSLFNLPNDSNVAKPKISFDEITLKNVYFKFSNDGVTDKYTLKNITLKLSGNSKLAIVGKTGSGKSTLANIISGLYSPTLGEIIYYSKNKKMEGLPKVNYLIQDGYLFDDSIIDNIKIANPKCSNESVHDIINYCYLGDVIDTHGQEEIGENGKYLSGGERKRLRLARVLSDMNANIYIFDELTSSLDEIMAKKILENVIKLLKNKLCIFIEHDLKVASLMDYIIVVDSGQIIEIGSHNELLNKRGLYYEMYIDMKGGDEI